jgi:hypothetical protein
MLNQFVTTLSFFADKYCEQRHTDVKASLDINHLITLVDVIGS